MLELLVANRLLFSAFCMETDKLSPLNGKFDVGLAKLQGKKILDLRTR